jgi:hypothetical protein
VAAGAVDAVVMSMALQLVPFETALAEVARVLRPGGLLVAIVPVSGPLTVGDRRRWGRLSVALRHRVSYPNDAELSSFAGTSELSVVSDEAQAFVVDVTSPAVADLLLDALYLPGVPAERIAAGRKVVATWVGHKVSVPIRRLVLQRT